MLGRFCLLKDIDCWTRNFIWSREVLNKRLCIVSWHKLCCPKADGGLGHSHLESIRIRWAHFKASLLFCDASACAYLLFQENGTPNLSFRILCCVKTNASYFLLPMDDHLWDRGVTIVSMRSLCGKNCESYDHLMSRYSFADSLWNWRGSLLSCHIDTQSSFTILAFERSSWSPQMKDVFLASISFVVWCHLV